MQLRICGSCSFNPNLYILGCIHSTGSTKGYCVMMEDKNLGMVWKRRKSLRKIHKWTAIKGKNPYIDIIVSFPCSNYPENRHQHTGA